MPTAGTQADVWHQLDGIRPALIDTGAVCFISSSRLTRIRNRGRVSSQNIISTLGSSYFCDLFPQLAPITHLSSQKAAGLNGLGRGGGVAPVSDPITPGVT
mgnify:CR=1 FL=1